MAAWRESSARSKREDRGAGTFAKRNGLRRRGEMKRGGWFGAESVQLRGSARVAS